MKFGIMTGLLLLLAALASAAFAANVTLISPANGNWTSQAQVQFTYSTDLANFTSCTLFLDNVASGSNTSSPGSITSAISGEGPHTWNVNCTDGNISQTADSPFSLFVDTIPPDISLAITSPANSTWIFANATASDSNLSTVTISLYNSSGSLDGPYTGSTHNFTNLAAGNYTLNATATDLAGNSNTTSQTATITVPSPPPAPSNFTSYVQLLSPASGSWHMLASANFSFAFIRNSTSASTCSLYINGSLNATNSSVQANATTSFQNIPLTWLPAETTVTWSVTCTGSLQNYSNSSTLLIDRLAPTISLAIVSPSNSTWIFANATANDTNLDYVRIRIYDSSGDLVESTTAATANFTNLAEDDYTINATAFDEAGNTATDSESATIDLTSDNTPQTSHATSSSSADVSAGNLTCAVGVARELSGTQTLSVVTTTLTNNGAAGCNLTNVLFTDTIPASFSQGHTVSFSTSPASQSGQSITFNLTALAPGQSKVLTYSIAAFAPATVLSGFTPYTISARLLLSSPPAPQNQTSNQTTNATSQTNQTSQNESGTGEGNESGSNQSQSNGTQNTQNQSGSQSPSPLLSMETIVLGAASLIGGAIALIVLIAAIYLFFFRKKRGGGL